MACLGGEREDAQGAVKRGCKSVRQMRAACMHEDDGRGERSNEVKLGALRRNESKGGKEGGVILVR